MNNLELMQKADLALADLTGAGKGGLLLPEQAASFVRKLRVQPTLIKQARLVTMNSPTMNINKIGFGKRILRKATSGVALNTAAVDGGFDPLAEATARAKPQTEQISMQTSEVIAEVRIPYDVMEDNIEKATVANNEASNDGPGGLRDTIIDLIAERAALDLEELAILGDTTLSASDPYLALMDGWLKRVNATGNVFDAQGSNISKEIFKGIIKTVPDEYLRNLSLMRNYVSNDQAVEYMDYLANRGTAIGDAALQGTLPLSGAGVPVERVALMPDSNALTTNPQNLIFGIQRQISMEYDKDITARVYIIVLTARVALQIEEAQAAVLTTNIGVQ